MISRLRPLRLQALRLTRPYSTTKPSNPTVSFSLSKGHSPVSSNVCQTQFYKTFTRPVFKVILTAVFTYQVVYWSWLKLEADEKRAETDGKLSLPSCNALSSCPSLPGVLTRAAEIRDLEKTVNEYESKRKEKK